MIKKIKTLVLVVSLLASALLFMPPMASADCSNPTTTQDQIQCGVNAGSGKATPGDAPKTLTNTAKTALNILSLVAGTAAVIMLMLGGLRYITSAGNPEGAKNAKNTILYAIIGLVVVAVAQVVVQFVLANTKT